MVVTTSYFGSVSLFEAVAASGCAQIQACENFQKQSPRSRCDIMTAGGARTLSVPTIHRSGEKIAIRQVEIDYSMAWQRNHWRSIVAAYASSPYWHHFLPKVQPLFELHEKYLFDLNLLIFNELLNILKIEAQITLTEKFSEPSPIHICDREYYQVFFENMPFRANLSILDAIFCVGQLPSAE